MRYSKTTGGFYLEEVHGLNIPKDAIEISSETYGDLMAGQSVGKQITPDPKGYPTLQDPADPSPDEVKAAYTAAVQSRLDDFARTRGYDGILSACSYATSTNAKFAAESHYCVTARDNTWAACYAIMADVDSGKRSMPTLDEIMAELPALTWDDNV